MRERTGAAFGMGAVVLGLCVSNEIPMFVYMRCGMELRVLCPSKTWRVEHV